jgi:hypothetical protein
VRSPDNGDAEEDAETSPRFVPTSPCYVPTSPCYGPYDDDDGAEEDAETSPHFIPTSPYYGDVEQEEYYATPDDVVKAAQRYLDVWMRKNLGEGKKPEDLADGKTDEKIRAMAEDLELGFDKFWSALEGLDVEWSKHSVTTDCTSLGEDVPGTELEKWQQWEKGFRVQYLRYRDLMEQVE